MVSSILSERAFLSGGITISKHWNRLKGDIVEALQVLKCLYHKDLIFREVVTVTKEEVDMEWEELKGGGDKDDAEGFSWDQLVVDLVDGEDNIVDPM